LQAARCWNGQALPLQLVVEIERMWIRRQMTCEQLRALERKRCQDLVDPQNATAAPMRQLMRLRGVGLNTAWILCSEIFAWREIANRRQLGALAGMAPTPFNSGNSEREQGIGKDGNRRVRATMVEIAWTWLRWQPYSELAQWFHRRFGTGSKRSKRIGIVALARRLLVALWRYHHDGVMPGGATFKGAA
jgi:transposase